MSICNNHSGYFVCEQDNLLGGQLWATGRFNLLCGQNNLLLGGGGRASNGGGGIYIYGGMPLMPPWCRHCCLGSRGVAFKFSTLTFVNLGPTFEENASPLKGSLGESRKKRGSIMGEKELKQRGQKASPSEIWYHSRNF